MARAGMKASTETPLDRIDRLRPSTRTPGTRRSACATLLIGVSGLTGWAGAAVAGESSALPAGWFGPALGIGLAAAVAAAAAAGAAAAAAIVLWRGRAQRASGAGARVGTGPPAAAAAASGPESRVDAARTAALLGKTLDCMDQGVILVGPDRTVQVANRRAREWLGLSEAFIASRPSYREVRALARRSPHWGSLVADTPLQLSEDDPAATHTVAERRNAEGTVLEIRTVRTEDGGLIQTLTDITERRSAEDRYRLLAENATDLISLQSIRGGTKTYVSPSARAVVGWEPEEFAQLTLAQQLHPDDLARVKREAASLTPDAPRRTSEYRLRHKSGHYVWVESTLLLTKPGTPDEALIIASRDVTARRAADDALRESEARHRLLAERTGDVIARADLDGTLRYLSPSVEPVTGYAADALLGRSAMAHVHPQDRRTVLHRYAALVAAGPGARAKFEYRVRHRHGHDVWLEVNPTVLYDEATGVPLGFVDVARDVTARKAVDAELAAAREQAEAARVHAELASQAKTDFLASMSHEIRTPLSSVIGYTELLLDDPDLTEGQRLQASRIRSAGSALLTVVDDILDFSKIEAGQVDLDLMPFALHGLIENAVAIVRQLAERKGLEIRVDIDPALPQTLVGDQNRLRQILLNFLNNALKFTRRGRVVLAVATAGSTDRGWPIRVSVTDTGIGIAPEQQARLFKRFTQVDGSIRREFGGTGLGLAISKKLIELMGGAIGVVSAPGEGSTFWFEVVLPEASAAPAPAEAPLARPVRPARILLVEDLIVNQDLARAVLERAGHMVDVANDGLEAIAAVQAKDYDLVLMDVQMPGMDGVTATRHIRALPQRVSLIPIIAMTANVLPAQVSEFRAAGMNDHLGKPFRRDELQAVIDRWIGEGTVAPHPGAGAAAAVDRRVYDDVVDLLGPDRLAHFLDELAREIRDRLSDARLAADDPQRLARDAHSLVASAGTLGFSELSGLCKQLEEACQSGASGDLLAAVRASRDRALDEIERLHTVA
ncbi:PAS domain S-box protein [Methylobacterium nodulans]|uniref:Sensory/regulatory protein RpfC n=1 Tax=Methylobacterium nodulans (strain LMG 21967 / CNCM I-2342 / ORS 2060) TaxID=460265 RepID=B8IUE5_METNO|nr:PAS domain S-box protein [Methylobacterium nodulans]ACL55190.1 multi-sensor hybrid histidine kinase [Methylobacterium nodulans ORS 2060]